MSIDDITLYLYNNFSS